MLIDKTGRLFGDFRYRSKPLARLVTAKRTHIMATLLLGSRTYQPLNMGRVFLSCITWVPYAYKPSSPFRSLKNLLQ